MFEHVNKEDREVELVTFYLGTALCGLDILNVQEISKLFEATRVPLAPAYVKGILNLRWRIITVIDLGKKLGLPSGSDKKNQRSIIVHFENESIGLLVDRLDEVVRGEINKLEKLPANIGGMQGNYFAGVLKTEKHLIGILNMEEVLK
jgi:purine-binding chemotaxis protein CheW